MCTCGAQLDDATYPCFCEWVVGASPRVTEAWTSLEGAQSSISSFNEDIDISMRDQCNNALPFYGLSDETDWSLVFNKPLPFLPAAPPSIISDDTGSSAGSSLDPPSPIYTDQLPFSPISDSLSSLTLVEDGDSDLTYGNMAPITNDFDFTFAYPCLSFLSSPCSPDSPTTPFSIVSSDSGYEQQVSQHAVGAAGMGAYGLGSQGVQGDMDDSMIPSTIPVPPSPGEDVFALVKRKDDANDKDTNEKSHPVKKRRRQDTTPRFPCPECGEKFARKNNLSVHIDSVHKGLRKHVCDHVGCTRAFSRKHDLRRHVQSKHTTLGSPRRKSPKAAKEDSE